MTEIRLKIINTGYKFEAYTVSEFFRASVFVSYLVQLKINKPDIIAKKTINLFIAYIVLLVNNSIPSYKVNKYFTIILLIALRPMID